jgi:hypothetical protein
MSIQTTRFSSHVSSGRGTVSPQQQETFQLTNYLNSLGTSGIAMRYGIPESRVRELGTSGVIANYGNKLNKVA